MKQTIEIVRRSIMSNNLNVMAICLDTNDMKKWKDGMLIQDAMPYLKNEEREFLMTGMSLEEQGFFFDALENNDET